MSNRRVFISHIHEEKTVALDIQGVIYDQMSDSAGGSIRCFLSSDGFQMMAGENWLGRIKAELSESDVVLLMLSEYVKMGSGLYY